MKILKNFLKTLIKRLSVLLVKLLRRFKVGRLILESINKETNSLTKTLRVKEVSLKLCIPNELNLFRVESFTSKEPETINWIDEFEKNSVFWDIGSNIGLFSCYAAIKNNSTVYSFEPSVFNLEILSKNINLNNLNEKITIFPLPLTNTSKKSKFKLSSVEQGGAISTFGEDYTYDGTKLNSIFDYKTVGISIDEIIKYFKFSTPDYIKIDVDGIEHLILSGGNKILGDVKEILVEVDEKFEKQFHLVNKILESNEFRLKKKIQLQNISRIESNAKIYNQVWVKTEKV